MHTLWLFLNWPNGTAWSNVVAMPLCAVAAGLAAFLLRDHLGRAIKGWWGRHLGHHDELATIREKLAAHENLLDHETPGGLGSVMAKLRDLEAEVAAARGGVEALSAIAKPTPRRGGATAMRKTATGKADGGQS